MTGIATRIEAEIPRLRRYARALTRRRYRRLASRFSLGEARTDKEPSRLDKIKARLAQLYVEEGQAIADVRLAAALQMPCDERLIAYELMMANSAQVRAVNYRQQAATFRELAETETGENLRRNLLRLAGQYEAMAAEVDPGSQNGQGAAEADPTLRC